MNEATVLIAEAEIKEGVSQKTGKPWKRLVVKDGNGDFYSTFESGLFDAALNNIGKRAVIGYEVDGNFKNLTSLREAEKPAQEKMGTGEYVTGQKPPIEARRIAALNASTNATAMTDALLRYQTSQEITPDLYRAAWDAMYNHVWMQNLRSCKIMEDDDIPFG